MLNLPPLFNFKPERLCYLCGAASLQDRSICIGCETDMPWILHGCEVCDLPMPLPGQVCPQCYQSTLSINRIFSAFSYTYPVNILINQFKYSGKRHLGQLLAELLLHKLNQSEQAILFKRADWFIPMPISPKRYRERSFNQASDLALWLGKKMNTTVVLQAVKREHLDQHQAAASRTERFKNMQSVLHLHKEYADQIQAKHIVVVDDVVTTGASVDSLANLLINAGARQVDVLCLARTPSPAAC
jgi:ComF family protein